MNSDAIDKWIVSASDEALTTKVEEYAARAQSWSGRDNEMTHKLLAKIKVELAGRKGAAE